MDEHRQKQLEFLSETHRAALDTRREYEWKTLTATLTFYVLVVAANYDGKFTLSESGYSCIAIWVLMTTVAILSIAYLWQIHSSNRDNKRVAEAAENAIAAVCGVSEVSAAIVKANGNRKRRTMNWSFTWQFVIICSFAIYSGWLIQARSKAATESPLLKLEKLKFELRQLEHAMTLQSSTVATPK